MCIRDRFKRMGLECFEPFGAFYVFPNISEFGMTSEEFATRFLMEEKVAVVPGTAFGECGEGFLRISYAYSLEDLKVALGRLERFIEKLRNEDKASCKISCYMSRRSRQIQEISEEPVLLRIPDCI